MSEPIRQITSRALKEVVFGAFQYVIYLFFIPLILRNIGVDVGLQAVWASLYFAIIITLSVITGIIIHHPIAIGFKLLRSILIVYVFLTAMNYGLIEQTVEGLIIRINFSILIYTLAAFTIIHSLLSSIDDLLGLVDRFKLP